MPAVPGYSHRCAITIDNTGSTSALSYYQVPITLSGAAYTGWAAHGKPDGSDLRVTDTDGVTLLPFVLERIDTANSKVYLTAKVPYTSAGAMDVIYVYWGNPSASSVSNLAQTIQATSSQTGPADLFNQSDLAGYTDGCALTVLKHQTGANASHNGEWLVWHNAGKSTNGNFTGSTVYMDRSTNNGSSWTKTLMLSGSGGNVPSVRAFGELLDGTLLLCWTWGTPTNTNATKVPLYLAKSTDAGATWSNLGSSPTNQLTVPWTVGTDAGTGFGRIEQLTSGGNIFLSVYGWPSAASNGTCYILKCPNASDPTNGSNWSTHGTPFPGPTDSRNYSEFSFCRTTDDNNWIAICRSETSPYDLYRAASTDGGATWGSRAAVNVIGRNPTSDGHPGAPCLLRLSNGAILLAYQARQGSKYGSTIRVSTDNGAVFNNTPGNQLMLHAPGGNDPRDYGMPSIDVLSDGRIAWVDYYAVTTPSTSNLEYSIVDLDYIMNGANVYSTCNSFDSVWTAHGATETSIDTTNKLTGTGSILIDNSTGTPTDNYALAKLWPDGDSGAPNLAFTYWGYIQQQESPQNAIQSTVESTQGTSEKRITSAIRDDGTGGVTFQNYNGSSYVDSNVVVNTTEWTKVTHAIATTSSTVSGKAFKNNVDVGLSISQWQTGSNPYQVRFLVGSTSSTGARKSNVGLVYSHQYTPTAPAVSAGAEDQLGGAAPISIITSQRVI